MRPWRVSGISGRRTPRPAIRSTFAPRTSFAYGTAGSRYCAAFSTSVISTSNEHRDSGTSLRLARLAPGSIYIADTPRYRGHRVVPRAPAITAMANDPLDDRWRRSERQGTRGPTHRVETPGTSTLDLKHELLRASPKLSFGDRQIRIAPTAWCAVGMPRAARLRGTNRTNGPETTGA